MSFFDTRFPTQISYGSQGGPAWLTDVVVMSAGTEQRNQRWSNTRHKYDVAWGIKTHDDLRTLIAFFNEMRGRLHTFRYQDPLYNTAVDEALTPDGSNQVQLQITYGSGFNNYIKSINKPVSGITMEHNASSFSGFSLDTSTGIATLTPLSSVSITNISSGSPSSQTIIEHSGISPALVNGETVYIKDATGVTSLNGNTYAITVIDPTTFSIVADTSAETYVSAGTVEKHVQPSDTLTWSGTYDFHCRFDTDELPVTLSDFEAGSTSCPIVEVRGE